MRFRPSDIAVALLALGAITWAVGNLEAGRVGLRIEEVRIGATPASVIVPEGRAGSAPAVVIAHGFAGSRALMQPFAFTLARAGYTVVSFDFIGHGKHPVPMPADIESEDGATRALLDQLSEVAAFARGLPGSDGRLAILGHSMATDVLARAAVEGIGAEAYVTVSLFSREVTATSPPNMLVIVGSLEAGLTDEALRVTELAARAAGHEGPVGTGVTYGSFAEGTARRAVFADGVEHIGVLYASDSMAAARDWLDAAFGQASDRGLDRRGPLLGLLFLGILALARPASRLLPEVAAAPRGASPGPWLLVALAVVPAVLTPPIAVVLPTGFLPLILGDYLALHFLVYGSLTAAGLWLAVRAGRASGAVAAPVLPLLAAAAGVAAYTVLAFGIALERYAFSFMPIPERVPLILAMLAGTLPWFLADEWLTRTASGRGTRLWAYALTKLCFVGSLAIAIALDLERLFFLIIVAPVILVFFVIYGTLSRWAMARTHHPWAAGAGLAVALAWAIAVSFPLIAA